MRDMCGTHFPLDSLVEFPVKALSGERIMQAFPLVREGTRCVSADAWKAYAGAFLGQGSDEQWPAGIMVAEQPNQCIVGLFSYFVRPCLRTGRVMVVADLAAVAPFGREIVADRLLDAIAALARQHCAKETEIALAHASAWWGTVFAKRGYVLDDRRRMIWLSAPLAASAQANASPLGADSARPLGSFS
jgi:hypothetical protein